MARSKSFLIGTLGMADQRRSSGGFPHVFKTLQIYWTWDDTVAEESSHGCIPGSADGSSRTVIKHVSCPRPRILTASVSSSFSDGRWSKNAWSSSFLGSNITTLFQPSFLEMFPHPLDPLDPLRHRPVRYGQFYSQSSSQVGRHQLEW